MGKGILNNKFIVVITLLSLLMLIVGCGNKAKETTAQKEIEEDKIPVEVVSAKTGKLSNYITIIGEVEAIKFVNITPQVQEEVKEVYVEVGDRVKKGEKLVELVADTLVTKVEHAKGGYDSAQAKLEKILNGAREEKLAQLKAKLKQTENSYEEAKKVYNRNKVLYKKEIISDQKLDSIKSKYIIAESAYKEAKEKLKLEENGPREEDVKMSKAQVAQTKASYEEAKLKLSKATISSPINGIISQVDIEAGEVSVMQPVISIANIDQIKLITYVSAKNINKIRTGDKVNIYFDSLDDSFVGKVDNISPVIDNQKKSFPVEIVVDNKTNIIKAGMYGEINFKVAESNEEIVILQKAILEDDIGKYVYIVNNDQVIRKNLKIGLSTKEKAVILEGVNLGDKIIVKGNENINENIKVEVVNRGDN